VPPAAAPPFSVAPPADAPLAPIVPAFDRLASEFVEFDGTDELQATVTKKKLRAIREREAQRIITV
jgi:hypothetical protein